MPLKPSTEWKSTCYLFPQCLCGEMWAHWQKRMAEVWENNPPTIAECDTAEAVIFDMLRCIHACAHDAKWRRKARRELNHPIFARQHQLTWRDEQERRIRWRQQ